MGLLSSLVGKSVSNVSDQFEKYTLLCSVLVLYGAKKLESFLYVVL